MMSYHRICPSRSIIPPLRAAATLFITAQHKKDAKQIVSVKTSRSQQALSPMVAPAVEEGKDADASIFLFMLLVSKSFKTPFVFRLSKGIFVSSL